uniref:Uncharacterized protein n=1 Tax=Esox lucius TaxID=8010 RepID=A0A3P9A0V2_ESOLU
MPIPYKAPVKNRQTQYYVKWCVIPLLLYLGYVRAHTPGKPTKEMGKKQSALWGH